MKSSFNGVHELLVCCLLVCGVVVSAKHQIPLARGILKKSDLPSTGWVTLESGVEFHANPALPKQHRLLNDNNNNNVYDKQFLDGSETYYDEYAQAWRLLGFYIDCNSQEEEYYYDYGDNGDNAYNDNGYRDLEEDVYNDDYGTVCTRYLLWAGYIDPNYEGGGIGEYQQFNRTTKKWDSSHCDDDLRCAKMDCHEIGTSYELLGIFKEANLENWFDLLVNHQGSCIWSTKLQQTLAGFQDSSNAWPLECTQSNTYDKDGNYIYYHTKPLKEGKISIGLYTESSCRNDYKGQLSVEDVLTTIYVQNEEYNDEADAGDDGAYADAGDDGYAANAGDDGYQADAGDDGGANAGDDAYVDAANYYYNNGGNRKLASSSSDATYSLYQSINKWNDAFDAFKICKPCKAWHDGSVCTDATGSFGANQCMLFSKNTKMNTATFKDAALASEQGTIVTFEMDGTRFGHGGFTSGPGWISITCFLVSLVIFVTGILVLYKARRTAAAKNSSTTASMKQPLVESSNGVLL